MTFKNKVICRKEEWSLFPGGTLLYSEINKHKIQVAYNVIKEFLWH